MKKIVVRAPNWLGDAIMSTPFLKRLREKNADARVDVLCRPAVRQVFEGAPGVDRVLPFGPGESPLAVAGRVRRENYDEGYVLPPSFSSALLLRLAGVPRRIGYATDCRRLLLTDPLRLDERYHYVRRYLGLLGEPDREAAPADFYFPAPKEDLAAAKRLLAERGVDWRRGLLAVAPGSQAPARRWPPERFAEFVNGCDAKTWPGVLILGSPSDEATVKDLLPRLKRPVVDLCGRTDLPLLGDVLRLAGALVTNESGMMHVAWAVGTPTVVLAGPSDPRITSPFGARVRVLQHREVPCVPCVKNECYRVGDEYKLCLKKIETAEVRAALAGLAATAVS